MANNKQQYKCKQCAYNFSIGKLKHGIDQQYVKQCLQLDLEGMGFSAIERVAGVSHVIRSHGRPRAETMF